MRKNEDPRLSFSTPEFKEAQRIFTDNLKVWTLKKRKKNFNVHLPRSQVLYAKLPKRMESALVHFCTTACFWTAHINAWAVTLHDRGLCTAEIAPELALVLVVLGTQLLLVHVQY